MKSKFKANEFKKLLLLKGYTQSSFAKKVGVSRQAIHYYASGKETPGVIMGHKICTVLNRDYLELFDFIEK